MEFIMNIVWNKYRGGRGKHGVLMNMLQCKQHNILREKNCVWQFRGSYCAYTYHWAVKGW